MILDLVDSNGAPLSPWTDPADLAALHKRLTGQLEMAGEGTLEQAYLRDAIEQIEVLQGKREPPPEPAEGEVVYDA